MSTQPAEQLGGQPLHPLVEHESVTSSVITAWSQRQSVSELFYRAEELEILGKFAEGYKELESNAVTYILSATCPSYSFVYGCLKLSQGYIREGKESYEKSKKIIQSSPVELSEGSRKMLDFMNIRLMVLDGDSAENRQKGMELCTEAYIKWARDKEGSEMDYFAVLIERAYFEVLKDLPDISFRPKILVSESGTDLLPALLESLRPRHLEILYAQIPKGNSLVSFPLFLAKINATKTLTEVQEMQTILDKLLKEHKAPVPLRDTIVGYCQIRCGQLTTGKEQGAYLKEANRLFKAAGNLEAPCEIEVLQCLRKGQENVVSASTRPGDLQSRILSMIADLGKLYAKFTEMDYPNRMRAILGQIHNINDKMLGIPDISATTCRLWRQLGKATGMKVNLITEFIAVMADIMTTDDIEDSLSIMQQFKDEHGSDWDADLAVNWHRGMGALHYRMSLYDEGIEYLDVAESMLKSSWDDDTAAEVHDQILVYKQERLATLQGDEKGYALDDLLDEIDESIRQDAAANKNWPGRLTKMVTKAMLLVGNKELVGLDRAVADGGKIVAELDRQVTRLVHEDSAYEPYTFEVQRCKAVLFKIQGKLDEAVAVIDKALPSKWKIHRSKTEAEEIREMQLRLLAVAFYVVGKGTEEADKVPPKTVEKRTKVALAHLKEAMKTGEKYNTARDYCNALYYKAICHLNQNDPVKAVEHLVHASEIQDRILRASPKSDKFDSFLANAVSMGNYTTGMVDTALKACLKVPDIVACWWWIQKAKARAFAGMMGHGHIWQDSFTRVIDDVSNLQMPWESVTVNFREIALIYRLESLMKTPTGYTLDNWDAEEMQARVQQRRADIQDLIGQIEQTPAIRGALGMSMGLPATHEDMTWLANYRQGDRDVIFVDWICCDDDIIISVYKPGGMRLMPGMSIVATSNDAQVRMVKCVLTLPQVKAWVDEYLKDEDMPLGSSGSFDDLDILNDLIEAIKVFTDPEDLLVLCPTNVLHGIPLHALMIDQGENGERITLIERNPVVYVPSFSILRQCVNRLRLAKAGDSNNPTDTFTRPATLVGVKVDYGNADPAVPVSMEKMSGYLTGAEVVLNEDCTLARFQSEAANTTDILHFHGHMDYSDPRPLQRYLVLAEEERITGRQMADLKFPRGTAPLVTLIACSSGGQQIMTGDEPIGVIPALLAAGASSVIATLWPTDSECGLLFGELLYKDRKGGCDPCGDEDRYVVGEGMEEIWNIAKGVRKAVLEIKAREETSRPYYWAPFALHGSWLRGTGVTGALSRGDGMNGLSAQFVAQK
ncbi:hypothetical protein H072_9092 [Dactylellina haptotyla CBS 200.50]|uniref:CHAT domain-containing protein n=1 Tax=Dactylellina haptotyla (strain CBS 200.50) TaxID=1284197 RepID=S8BDH4_DACHA|nr:hypothetical protein H072_9092 [Dactylellina haptotyla CBS 200.50]